MHGGGHGGHGRRRGFRRSWNYRPWSYRQPIYVVNNRYSNLEKDHACYKKCKIGKCFECKDSDDEDECDKCHGKCHVTCFEDK